VVLLLLFFSHFLRAMVIYPNLCNHSCQQWQNQVTTLITSGSLLVPIDSNPHSYVWMELQETRKKRGGVQPPSTSQKLGWIKSK
jgi:hypothetical protein